MSRCKECKQLRKLGLRLRCSERGNIAPLVVVSVLLLFTVLSFAVDQSIAYGQKLKQEDVLEQMRLTCMDASFGLSLKNSNDPGREVALAVSEIARAEGFEGSIKVWFYEKPREEVGPSTRFWVMGFQLQEASPTIFAKGWGLASIPVASWKVITAQPYASKQVWRPASASSGKYVCAQGVGADEISFQSIASLEAFPQEMVAAAG